MKIAIYTPFNAESAIGRFALIIAEELHARGCYVEIIRCENLNGDIRNLPIHQTHLPVIEAQSINESPMAYLSSFDTVLYNIGDNFDYHFYAFEHLARFPGIVILHDYVLHHMFFGWLNQKNLSLDKYYEIIDYLYGSDAAIEIKTEFDAGRAADWGMTDIIKYPLFEWGVFAARGVVTHANFYQEKVNAFCGCPTITIPLAYNSPQMNNLVNCSSNNNKNHNEFNIVTFGCINPNKRPEAVIRAIAASEELQEKCNYNVVGLIQDDFKNALLELAEKLGVKKINFTGRVSDDVLADYLVNADIITCLRYPAFEGASASAIEALLLGKPVIVTDNGFYSDLPGELVFKINPENEHDNLVTVLEKLTNMSHKMRHSFGEKVKIYAEKQFSAQQYVEKLLNFVKEVQILTPLCKLSENISKTLFELNVAPDSELIASLGKVTDELFIGKNAQEPRYQAIKLQN